jgi:predicted alpha/beta superfamily hydrolase
MPQLNRTRRIWVYLPPDYHSSSKHYPVIYMHDGQNLFDNATSYAGEWGVDETLNQLNKAGDYGAIVVGIDNGAAKRMDEYSPWKHERYGGGEGDAYMDFIKYTLKPEIDKRFRTKKDAANNCLWGSSMGGLISAYGVIKYPETFGVAGVFSPSYWFALPGISDSIRLNKKDLSNLKIVHYAGAKEDATMVANMEKIMNELSEKNIPKDNLKIMVNAEGQHSEKYWQSNFAEAYRWIFSKK